jgi:hypothetical protein
MRITIDIDGVTSAAAVAPTAPSASPEAPPEVLAQAAASGAINAGPAPGSWSAAPQPSAPAETTASELATAISAGAAPS